MSTSNLDYNNIHQLSKYTKQFIPESRQRSFNIIMSFQFTGIALMNGRENVNDRVLMKERILTVYLYTVKIIYEDFEQVWRGF